MVMNDLTKELALKVGISVEYLSNTKQWVLIEALAESIVRECVKVVDDMADPKDSERYFWAIQNASEKIKQHFGVEE
jgi:hypothetical protein